MRFDPFRFTLDADQVDLRGADGAPLLEVEHLTVDASPSDLLHRTWTLAQVTLTGPQVHLVLERDIASSTELPRYCRKPSPIT